MVDFLERRLRLRSVVHIIPVDEERYVVTIGSQRKVIEGKSAWLLPHILERIDGSATVQQIVAAATNETGANEADLIATVRRLYDWTVIDDDDGYHAPVVGGDLTQFEAQIQCFGLVSSRPYAIQERIRMAHVVLIGPEDFIAPVGRLLAASGVGHIHIAGSTDEAVRVANTIRTHVAGVEVDTDGTEYLPQCDLVVYATRSSTHPRLREDNERCLEYGRPILLFGTSGFKGFVGPLTIPHESACVACLNASIDHIRHRFPNAPSSDADGIQVACELGSLPSTVASVAAAEAVKFLSRAVPPSVIGRQLVVDLMHCLFDVVEVTKVPRCPACGTLRQHSPVTAFEFGMHVT